jgi:hypothetical protein
MIELPFLCQFDMSYACLRRISYGTAAKNKLYGKQSKITVEKKTKQKFSLKN